MTRPELPQNSRRATLAWTDDGQLMITWDDGHESVYTLAYLRRACPCARCRAWPHRDEHDLPLLPQHKLDNIEVNDVNPIGRYAVHFVWNDGHQTGYYPYRYLRKICPCEACQSENSE